MTKKLKFFTFVSFFTLIYFRPVWYIGDPFLCPLWPIPIGISLTSGMAYDFQSSTRISLLTQILWGPAMLIRPSIAVVMAVGVEPLT